MKLEAPATCMRACYSGRRTLSSVHSRITRRGGNTWKRVRDLQTEQGEFSYPAIVSRGNQVFITYTWKRENIAYWEFIWHD